MGSTIQTGPIIVLTAMDQRVLWDALTQHGQELDSLVQIVEAEIDRERCAMIADGSMAVDAPDHDKRMDRIAAYCRTALRLRSEAEAAWRLRDTLAPVEYRVRKVATATAVE